MGKGLRITTLTALVVLLAYQAVQAAMSLRGTLHVRGLIACVVISLAVFLALRFRLRLELGSIVRHREILYPLALLTVVEHGLLPLLTGVVAPLAATTPIAVGAITLGLSVSAVLIVAMNVAYAVWMTFLVVQALDGPVSLDEPRRGLPGRSVVLAIVALIGWTTPLVALGALIPVLGAGGIGVMLPLMAIASLVWNLGTSAWLVGAASRGWGVKATLVEGWRTSWSGLRRFGGVVVLQLLLTGWLTFFQVRYSPGPGSHTSRTTWHVNVWWSGAYKHMTEWYDDYMAALEHGQLAFVVIVLQLVLGVLAIAVRMRVARHVAPVAAAPAVTEPAPDERPELRARPEPGLDYDEY